MEHEPFLARDGAVYRPNPISHGAWGAGTLHARVASGLLAAEVEAFVGDPEMIPARYTIDLYRLPEMAPAQVSVRPVREGRRIQVVDADYLVDGVSMARATCHLLRRSENPEGRVWRPPDWGAAKPDQIDASRHRAGFNGMWETRLIEGVAGGQGVRRLWFRDIRELIAGRPLTPFVRVALAADYASPFANLGEKSLGFINSDITVYLHRLPITEWIGFDVKSHQATAGVAIGECWLYDEEGAIGSATVSAIAQQRRPRVP